MTEIPAAVLDKLGDCDVEDFDFGIDVPEMFKNSAEMMGINTTAINQTCDFFSNEFDKIQVDQGLN